MSLTATRVNIEIYNKKINFIECDAKNNKAYVLKDILSISKIGLLSNIITLYYKISYPLVFVIEIENIGEIKIVQSNCYWYRI